MTINRQMVAEFFRPTAAALSACAVLAGLSAGFHAIWRGASSAASASAASDASLAAALARASETIRYPAPAFTPEEVIATQLAGLAAPGADGMGILQCFLFASPQNRRQTGPLDHFAQMVRGGEFRHFSNPKATLIGAPVIDGHVAYSVVTLIDQQGTVQAYVWLLQRQTGADIAGCWMTEGVIPVGKSTHLPQAGEEKAAPRARKVHPDVS